MSLVAILQECIIFIFRVICSLDMSVTFYKTTWHHNPEDHHQNLHCHKNPKSYKEICDEKMLA
jgi:hypothetical protein